MLQSITTDYAVVDKGNPSPYLRRIADAGFTHIHWCHHWNTDFVYSRSETEQIGRWLDEFSLKLLDLHASVGPEKNWSSANEWERQAALWSAVDIRKILPTGDRATIAAGQTTLGISRRRCVRREDARPSSSFAISAPYRATEPSRDRR
jgi:hypothetical protein